MPNELGFLDGLRSAGWFWDDKIFDGYEIYETISKVVEE